MAVENVASATPYGLEVQRKENPVNCLEVNNHQPSQTATSIWWSPTNLGTSASVR